MDKPLKVLVIEDCQADLLLVERHLKQGGLTADCFCAAGMEDLIRALNNGGWNIVLADYSVPTLNFLDILNLIQKHIPDTPVILVSGTVGEEKAVELLKIGIDDFVLKSNLVRLVPAIRRSLQGAAERLARRSAEAALHAEHEKMQQYLAHSPAVLYTLDFGVEILAPMIVSDNIQRLLGFSMAESNKSDWWWTCLHPDDRTRVLAMLQEAKKGRSYTTEYRLRDKDGVFHWVQDSNSIMGDETGRPRRVVGVWTDISERKSLQSELQIREEQLNSFFRGATAGLALLDPDLRYIHVNHTLAEMHGLPAAEHIGRTVREVVPELAEAVEPMLVQVLDTGMPILNVEITGETPRNPDNRRYWIESFFPVVSDDGIRRNAGLIAVEITEHKRAEKSLKESESKYRLLADNVNDVIFILDMNLNYTYISPSVKFLRGYESEEALKQSPTETMTPSSRDLAMRTLADAMELERSGQRDLSMSRTLQLEIKRKDGTTVWTEMKFSFVRDENQRPLGIMGVTRDITERKRAEETLRESEERYRALFDGSLDLVFVVDFEGRFIDANNAALNRLGYTKEEISSVNFASLLDEDQLVTAFEELNEMRKGNIHHNLLEFRLRHKDGSEVYVETQNSVVVSNGTPIAIQGIARDITERKRTEERLQQTMESLKKSFGATIQVLVSAAEARDPYTAGHQLRSANLASAIAMEMGLSQEKMDGIRMAGSIHDIGKLSIPAEILSRPAKLSEIEFSLIKEHPLCGYEMVKDVESPWPLAQIIYQHHERMNGTGYPRNLKGDEIIMEARIMAVADVVEAMASHRPYRAALGIEAALEEIERSKGRLYDPDVACACLKLFREKGFQLEVL